MQLSWIDFPLQKRHVMVSGLLLEVLAALKRELVIHKEIIAG